MESPNMKLIGELADSITGLDAFTRAFHQMDWAEDEIGKARVRHGEKEERGPLWRSFPLLRRSHVEMPQEIIYRAHVREILDRVAAGKDVRPGTDAEMITVLRDTSLVAPFTPSAACLYFRIMARSFPTLWDRAGDNLDLPAYETLHGSAADDHEAELRRRLTTERVID